MASGEASLPTFQEEFSKVFHKVIPDLFALKRDGFSFVELYQYARRHVNRYPALQRRRGLFSAAELLHLMLLWAIYKGCVGIVRQLVPLVLPRTRLALFPRFALLPAQHRSTQYGPSLSHSGGGGGGGGGDDDLDDNSSYASSSFAASYDLQLAADLASSMPSTINDNDVGVESELEDDNDDGRHDNDNDDRDDRDDDDDDDDDDVDEYSSSSNSTVAAPAPAATTSSAKSFANDIGDECDEATKRKKIRTLLESLSSVLVDHADFEVNALTIALCRNRIDVLRIWAACDIQSLLEFVEQNLCVAVRLAHKLSPDMVQFLEELLLASGRHSQEELTFIKARCGQIAFFDSAHFRRLPWCLAVVCCSWRPRDIAPLLDDVSVNQTPLAFRGALLAAASRVGGRHAASEAARITDMLLTAHAAAGHELTPQLCDELVLCALRNNHPRVIDVLLSRPQFDASRCGASLVAAAGKGLCSEVARLMAARGGPPPFNACCDAVTAAASNGHVAVLKALQAALPGVRCLSALIAAVQHGHVDVVQHLLLGDAEFARSEAVARRADILCAAVENGHTSIADLLLRHTQIDPTAAQFAAPIRAATFGQVGALRLLLADPRVRMTGWQNTALKLASYNCHTAVLQFLLRCEGVDPTHDDSSAARWCRSVSCLKVLLADGRVDTGARTSELIFSSARDGKEALVEALLKDPNSGPAAHNNRVLYAAVRKNRVRIVRMLLADPRVDPTDRDYRCYTMAVRFGRSACLEAMLEDERGKSLPALVRASLVDYAIKFPTSDGVRMLELLMRRAVVDANFPTRFTAAPVPLTQAVLYQRPDMVELLIRCGADVDRTLNDIDSSALQTSLRPALVLRRSVRPRHADSLRAALTVLRYGRIIINGMAPIFDCLTHWLACDILAPFDEHRVLSERHMHFLVQTLQQRRFFASRADFGTELLLVDGETERWVAQLMAASLERLLPQPRKRRRGVRVFLREMLTFGRSTNV